MNEINPGFLTVFYQSIWFKLTALEKFIIMAHLSKGNWKTLTRLQEFYEDQFYFQKIKRLCK